MYKRSKSFTYNIVYLRNVPKDTRRTNWFLKNRKFKTEVRVVIVWFLCFCALNLKLLELKCGEKKWREKILESFSEGEVKPESLKRIEEMTGTEVTFYLADITDKRQLQQVFDKVRKWYDRWKSNFKSIISNKWYILSDCFQFKSL